MGDKGDKSAARPPEGCPAEAGGLFGLDSALGFEHPSGTNARRPSQKAGGGKGRALITSKPHLSHYTLCLKSQYINVAHDQLKQVNTSYFVAIWMNETIDKVHNHFKYLNTPYLQYHCFNVIGQFQILSNWFIWLIGPQQILLVCIRSDLRLIATNVWLYIPPELQNWSRSPNVI